MPSDARYAFIVDWYDTAACMIRKYQLVYYDADGTIEMFDLKNRRTFLSRCVSPGVRPADLYQGGIVTVYARQLTVVEYGDAFTAAAYSRKTQMTVAYIKAESLPLLGKALEVAASLQLTVVDLRMVQLAPAQAASVFANASLAASASKGPLVAAKLSGEDAVAKWSAAIAGQAGVGGSASGAAAEKEATWLFSAPLSCAKSAFEESSLLLVRPHAVRDGNLGPILDQLAASGFAIAGVHMITLTRPNALEFFEVYKGVVPEFVDWVDEVVGGKSVALQVVKSGAKDGSVLALRELCGAHDPEIARHLHPASLRARFGEDKVKNAVHCTDLPEDGPLELDYFFSLCLA